MASYAPVGAAIVPGIGGPTGCTSDSLLRVMKSKYFVCRVIAFVGALVSALACYSPDHHGDYTSLNYMNTIGFVSIAWLIVHLVMKLFALEAKFSSIWFFTLAFDTLFGLLVLVGAAAVAADAHEFEKGNKSSANIAAIMAFVSFFGWLGNSVLAWTEYARPPY